MKSLFYFFSRVNFLISEFLLKKIKINTNNFKEVNLLELFYVHLYNKNVLINNVFLKLLGYVPFFKRDVLSYYLKKKLFLNNFYKKKNYFKFKKANVLFFKNEFFKKNNFINKSSIFSNCFFFYVVNTHIITISVLNSINFFTKEFTETQIRYFFNLYFCKFFDINKIKTPIYFLNDSKISDVRFFLRYIYDNSTNSKYSAIDPLSDLLKKSASFASLTFSEEEFKKNIKLSNLDKKAIKKSFFLEKINILEPKSDLNFLMSLKNCSVFFSKKNYLYNKGKFSRNRQTYRTGVYLCIWLTVLTVIGLYFYFYLMSFKFTYFYLLFLFFIFLFFYKFFTKKKNVIFDEHINMFNNF